MEEISNCCTKRKKKGGEKKRKAVEIGKKFSLPVGRLGETWECDLMN